MRRPRAISAAEEAAAWARTFSGAPEEPTPEEVAEAEAEFATEIARLEALRPTEGQ